MKQSIADLVIDKLHQRREMVQTKLMEQLKNTKPFRMTEIPKEEMLANYNNKGFEIFSEIANNEGMEQAISYRDEMERLKRKQEVKDAEWGI